MTDTVMADPERAVCPDCGHGWTFDFAARRIYCRACAAPHTPGPWAAQRAVADDGACWWEITAANQPYGDEGIALTQPIATCYTAGFLNVAANARLIAAAPELLVALRDLCDAIPDETLVADPTLKSWVDTARLLIAKVEGR